MTQQHWYIRATPARHLTQFFQHSPDCWWFIEQTADHATNFSMLFQKRRNKCCTTAHCGTSAFMCVWKIEQVHVVQHSSTLTLCVGKIIKGTGPELELSACLRRGASTSYQSSTTIYFAFSANIQNISFVALVNSEQLMLTVRVHFKSTWRTCTTQRPGFIGHYSNTIKYRPRFHLQSSRHLAPCLQVLGRNNLGK